MPDGPDAELAEERARAERRADLPLDDVDWPTTLPPFDDEPPEDPTRGGPPLVGGDISHHQGDIAVEKLGVSYLWAKATEVGFVDKKFGRNRLAAAKLGIPFGSYSFLRPGADVPAAVHTWHGVAGPARPGDLRPALDIEVPGFTASEVRAYVAEVARVFGCKPVVYIAQSIYQQSGMKDAVSGCALWIPRYGGLPKVPGWAVHQYTDAMKTPVGSIDGNHAERLDPCLVPGGSSPPPSKPSAPAPLQEDDMFSDADRQLLVDVRQATERLEARGLRQIQDPSGIVYLFNGETRVWVRDETERANLASAFKFGPPEQWDRATIEKMPLVGPEAPGVTPA